MYHPPCRSDGLELLRWAKGFKDASGRVREEEDADYFFAKFNKKVCARKAGGGLHGRGQGRDGREGGIGWR